MEIGDIFCVLIIVHLTNCIHFIFIQCFSRCLLCRENLMSALKTLNWLYKFIVFSGGCTNFFFKFLFSSDRSILLCIFHDAILIGFTSLVLNLRIMFSVVFHIWLADNSLVKIRVLYSYARSGLILSDFFPLFIAFCCMLQPSGF